MHFTCFDLVLQGVSTVLQKLVQGERFFRDLEIQLFLQFIRMVEVHDLAVAVVGVGDEVQEDLDDVTQKLASVLVALLEVLTNGENGCKKRLIVLIFEHF